LAGSSVSEVDVACAATRIRPPFRGMAERLPSEQAASASNPAPTRPAPMTSRLFRDRGGHLSLCRKMPGAVVTVPF